MSIKESLDLYTIVGNKNVLDVYKVLEKTQLFINYPKTKNGVIEFYQTELHNEFIKFENFTFVIDIHNTFQIKYSILNYLKIILLPLFHCGWDIEMKSILNDVINDKSSVNVISFAEKLIPGRVTLEMVPYDWRDIVEDLIRDKGLDITKFKTVKELEDYVDSTVVYSTNSPEDEYYTPVAPPSEPILMEDEKKIIAQTFRLDPNDFNTKTEAMKLYEYKNKN